MESAFETVDSYEIDADAIFTYIFTHGKYENGNSWIDLDSIANNYFENLSDIRDYMDDWEANRKCLLVDACEAGEFPDDFAASPYLVMSSSNETTSAYTYSLHQLPWEGQFSNWFFYAIFILEYTGVNAFNYASNNCDDPDQYPKKQDYSSYTWFN
ncbi:MAG: hypothetical protein JXA54_13020 [Candidatus Heimdallarchaeota archaeon]|nr:hypothetical protein [Candidatus Heimdallarchaeota archaeon]